MPGVIWRGQGGLLIRETRDLVLDQVRQSGIPAKLVIHVGANDIMRIKSHEWRVDFESLMTFLRAFLKHSKLFWSQMLPRRHYRYEINRGAGESCRKYLLVRARTAVYRAKAEPIKHDNISLYHLHDGVHLDTRHMELFINNIRDAVKY